MANLPQNDEAMKQFIDSNTAKNTALKVKSDLKHGLDNINEGRKIEHLPISGLHRLLSHFLMAVKEVKCGRI